MELLDQLMMVLVVLGSMAGLLWLLRRKGLASFQFTRGGKRGERSLEVIDRLALTPQHSLHLVRMADRVVLIGLSPSSCTILASPEVPAPKIEEPRG